MAFTVTIAGVTKTIQPGWSIDDTANGRARLTCETVSYDGTYRPAIGAEVILSDAATVLFGGYIDTPAEEGWAGSAGTAISTKITAVDYNSLAGRRNVVNTTYPVGQTLKQVLTSLVSTYLAAYGVTLSASQVTGPTLPVLDYDVRTLSAVLDELSVLTGYVWNIDFSKTLRMWAPGDIAAPVSITEANQNAIGDITVEPSRADYANKITVLAGSGTSEVSDSFTGNGSTTAFTLNYKLSTHRGYVTSAGVFETLGTSGATWILDPVANTITRTSAPGVGAAIVITYIAQFPYVVTANNLTDQATNGITERIITAKDTFERTVAQALADGWLVRGMAAAKQTVRYPTKQKFIRPGQTQTITVAKRNISGTFLVTDVRTQHVSGDSYTLFVTAISGTDYPGSWRDTFTAWSGGTTGTTVGGGTGFSLPPTRPPYFLGGGGQNDYVSAASTSTWMPCSGLRVTIDSTARGSTAGTIRARVRGRASMNLTVRLQNITDASTAGSSSATAVTDAGGWTDVAAFSVALATGAKVYELQMQESVANAAMAATGTFE